MLGYLSVSLNCLFCEFSCCVLWIFYFFLHMHICTHSYHHIPNSFWVVCNSHPLDVHLCASRECNFFFLHISLKQRHFERNPFKDRTASSSSPPLPLPHPLHPQTQFMWLVLLRCLSSANQIVQLAPVWNNSNSYISYISNDVTSYL